MHQAIASSAGASCQNASLKALRLCRWRLAIWDCNPEEVQWSCAYTVHSILVQLQAFLISEDMLSAHQVSHWRIKCTPTANFTQTLRHELILF